MSSNEKIAIVSNLTSGGGVVYKNNLLGKIPSIKKLEYFPRKMIIQKNKLLRIVYYIKYVYIDLFRDYYDISQKINKNKDINKVIVFQDSYIKAPYLLLFLKKKVLYILHEPPREFYEPISMHAPRNTDKLFNYFIRLPIKYIDLYLTKKATHIISNSEYSKKIIRKIYNKDSIMIYPGIGLNENLPIKFPSRENVCISVGSLLPYKGHAESIKAVSEIKQNRPKLIIIGNGTHKSKNYLIQLAHGLNVEIEVKNSISDKELTNEYLKAKVYINNAFFEPFGLAALEAIFCGCVLVTNETGGTKELKKYFPNKVLISESMKHNMSIMIQKGFKIKNRIPNKSKTFDWKNIAKLIKEI